MTKHRMETEKKLLQICEFVHFFYFFLGCQFIFLNSGLCYRYKIMLSAETSLTLIYEAFYFSGKSPQKVKVRIFFFLKTFVLPDKNACFTAFWITTEYTLCSF